MEKDRVILTMFRDDVRRMIENAEDKKLDNVLTFFKSANVYSGAADSPIVHVVTSLGRDLEISTSLRIGVADSY